MKFLNQFSILSHSVYLLRTRWIAEHDHSDYSLIVSCKGSRIPESRKVLLLEWESWALESGVQLKESGIPLAIGIQNLSSGDKGWNPVIGIRNPSRGIQNPRPTWIPLHGTTLITRSRLQGLESKVCTGFVL